MQEELWAYQRGYAYMTSVAYLDPCHLQFLDSLRLYIKKKICCPLLKGNKMYCPPHSKEKNKLGASGVPPTPPQPHPRSCYATACDYLVSHRITNTARGLLHKRAPVSSAKDKIARQFPFLGETFAAGHELLSTGELLIVCTRPRECVCALSLMHIRVVSTH